MKQFTLWEGEYNLASQRAKIPVLGDPPMELTVVLPEKMPDDLPFTEKTWFCFDSQVNQFSDVRMYVYFEDANGRRVQTKCQQMPNVMVHYRLLIDELWNRRLFLPVFPGSYKNLFIGQPMDPRNVRKIVISIEAGVEFRGGMITRVYLSDEQPAGITTEKPIMDELGQLVETTWPTKTPDFDTMSRRLKAEYEVAQRPAPPIPGRSIYGGFTEKRFEATGYFRTLHDGKRWWLVDPEGYAFFSHGICYGTRMGEFGWYSGMEKFYSWVPDPDDPEFRDAFTHPGLIAEYVKRHGITERSNEWMFNPARANMIRVFGKENWWEAWRAITTRRFAEWGINTTGVGIVNFDDEHVEDFLRISRLPYAVTLKRFPVTEHFIFRDFPDVFAPEYKRNSDAFARRELAPMANDPYLLGYFMHNEPEWMFQLDVSIAFELLVKPEPLKTRAHLKAWLQNKYGTVSALNEAWALHLGSFDDFLEPLPRSIVLSRQGEQDLKEYEQILIDAFGLIPMEACKRVAPHHLCLGMRYSRVTDKVLQSCRRFDVFSFNCYNRTPQEKIEQARVTGKPMIIGEWHFGAPDTGLRRTALLSAINQEERGKAYRRYMETVASDPNMVGAHYFEYNNQTVMGRFDGEHMAHGIIDCTNLPYPHMVNAIKTTSARLYGLMTGELKKYDEEIQYLDPAW